MQSVTKVPVPMKAIIEAVKWFNQEEFGYIHCERKNFSVSIPAVDAVFVTANDSKTIVLIKEYEVIRFEAATITNVSTKEGKSAYKRIITFDMSDGSYFKFIAHELRD